jgi:hypothetical protein
MIIEYFQIGLAKVFIVFIDLVINTNHPNNQTNTTTGNSKVPSPNPVILPFTKINLQPTSPPSKTLLLPHEAVWFIRRLSFDGVGCFRADRGVR